VGDVVRLLFAACIAGVILVPTAAVAEDAATRFTISAVPVASPPKIDGTLDDPAWKQAAHVQLLWDTSYRKAATESTDVYFMSDSKYIYVAFVCKQSEPITATQHTNDQPLGTDDVVRVFLWPGGDQGFEYMFAANPIGTRYAVSGENAAYSPAWDSVTSRTPQGYVVTDRIPVNVMRGDGRSTWRVQFDRRILVNNQMLVWSHDPAMGSDDSVLYTGYLQGMKGAGNVARTKARANLYALGEAASRTIGGSTSRVGADIAIPITQTSSFLATFHPDYSNVELDQQTISPTAFPRRFQEVRPFFTQGANFYSQFNCNDCIDSPFLYTPNIPTPREGYAVEGVQGHFNFGAFDSLSSNRTDAAQAMQYATPNRSFYELFERVAVNQPGVRDDATYFQTIVGNSHNFNVYATLGNESGTLVTNSNEGQYREYGLNFFTPKNGIFAAYHDVGAQYAPLDSFNQINDVKGPTIFGYQEIDFGPKAFIQNFTLSQDIGQMHNHLGQINDAYDSSSFTINTRNLFSFSAVTGSNYLRFPGEPGGVANQNGAGLTYGGNTSAPSFFTYNVGNFGAGYVHAGSHLASLKLGKRGTLALEADNTLQIMQDPHVCTTVVDVNNNPIPATQPTTCRFEQWLERASYAYQIDPRSSLAIGVRRIIGVGPVFFTMPQFINASNVTFAYYRRIGRGEVYVVYGDPNALATTPGLIVKYIFYAGAQKGT
jgi:hypothetical protein